MVRTYSNLFPRVWNRPCARGPRIKLLVLVGARASAGFSPLRRLDEKNAEIP
jgi:hypothetical protein